MAESFAKKHNDLKFTTKQLLDSVYVEHAATIVRSTQIYIYDCTYMHAVTHTHTQSSLSIQLQYKLPSLLKQQKVKLIVLDSLAALFRVEFSGEQAVQRAQLLRAFGAQLKRISDEFSAPVICINQVVKIIIATCIYPPLILP